MHQLIRLEAVVDLGGGKFALTADLHRGLWPLL
jgi:hypothetical protein